MSKKGKRFTVKLSDLFPDEYLDEGIPLTKADAGVVINQTPIFEDGFAVVKVQQVFKTRKLTGFEVVDEENE